MKIDDERPYHSNVFHELVSNGGPKVDSEPERETKHNLLADKMVEQTNPSEHSFTKNEHQNGGKTGQIRIEYVSYDKDVVEIKLPDTVVSSDYGGNFVKDVCIDEGVLADQKVSAEKVSSNGCHETGVNIASETNNLNGPVGSTADGFSAVMPEEDAVGAALHMRGLNQVNHYNPFIAYGSLEDTWEPKYSLPTIVDAASVIPICPVEKIDSFRDLVNGALGGFDTVETAESRIEDSRLDSVEARSSRLDVHASEESNDRRGSPVEKTDSFSDLVKGALGGHDSIETDEARVEDSRLDSIEASSSRLDVQASEESNDQRENLVNEIRTDAAHGTSIVTSVSTSSAEPCGVKSENQPKCEIDSVQDVHDFNPRDVEDGTKRSEDNTNSKSSVLVQTGSVVQQNGSDSAKLMARTGIHKPFESSFSGPTITSGPLTPSGHIPYSGNISLRSDSSTSTRSFAFPVLQTEWNSSPVKMVKADRSNLRRDRGWGYRILCCKF